MNLSTDVNSVWYKDRSMKVPEMMARFDRIVAHLIANPIIKPQIKKEQVGE